MSVTETVQQYGAALAAGDMAALEQLLDDNIVWHQPGNHPLAGEHVGKQDVMRHLANFAELSGGTFALTPEPTHEHGPFVAMPVRFTAQRSDRQPLDQLGLDIFRVVEGRIVEVWLMSEDQRAEDAFWS